MLTMQNGTKYYRENELEKFGYVKIEELKLDIITKFGNIKVYGLSQRYIKEIRNLEKEILEMLK